MWDYKSSSLVYNGVEYESLAALTEKLDFPSWSDVFLYSNEFRSMGRFKLNDLLVFGGWEYADYEGFDYATGGEPETEYILVTAVRSNPLACAISALRNIYIVTRDTGFSAVSGRLQQYQKTLSAACCRCCCCYGGRVEKYLPSGKHPLQCGMRRKSCTQISPLSRTAAG